MPPSSSLAIAHPMLNDDLLYGPRGSYRRKAEEKDPHDDDDGEEEEEIALKDLLPSLLLRADDSADLLLVGVDADFEQSQIRAHRCILAARSAVFERMLYGPFAEALAYHGNNKSAEESSGVVRIGFEHDILRAVVEYCYTDRAAMFDLDADVDLEGWARSMVRLCAAADYFRLPGLASTVRDILAERMTDDDEDVVDRGRPAALACAVLDEAECHGGGFVCGDDYNASAAPVVITGVGKVHEAAMSVIRCNAFEALLHVPLDGGGGSVRGVEMCGPAAMETILSDGGVMVDELTMFRALHRWADAAEEVNGGRRRLELAMGMSDRHIHLTRITSEDLRTVVAPTGLVRPDLLEPALRERTALEGGHGPRRPLPPPCRGPAWDVSGSAVLECTEPHVTTSLLNCEGLPLAMTMTPGSGVHRWSVEVIKLSVGDNDEIGVALTGGIGDRTSWLSRRENMAWVCESRGNAYHGGKCRSSVGGAGGDDGRSSSPLEFGPGSVVSFELDLTSPAGCGGGGGRLSVSVDGGSTWVELFDDMLRDEGRRQQRQRKPSQDDGGEDGDGDGETPAPPISFVPAVSLYHRAAVRFLGFETTGRA